MTRKFFFFSEMGYNAYPDDILERYGFTALLLPNSIFDREKARDLWQMFLREHEYASETGFPTPTPPTTASASRKPSS